MTIRTTIVDNRIPVTTSCGVPLVGAYFSKVQNGTNSPRGAGMELLRRENPYSMSYYSILDSQGLWKFNSPPDAPVYSGTYPACFGGVTTSTPPPAISDNSRLKAFDRLLSKAKEHEFNAAVALAEAPEALKMITSSVLRMARSFKALRRGDFPKAISQLTGYKATRQQIKSLDPRMDRVGHATDVAFSRNVLEVQYGWRPLIGDISEAVRALNVERVSQKRIRYRLGVSGSLATAAGLIPCGRHLVTEQYIWVIRSRASTGPYVLLEELGFLDPELVLWEKIPFSFVADWFIPVGTFLQTRGAIRRIDGQSIKTVVERQSVDNPPLPSSYIGSLPYKYRVVTLNRTVGSVAETDVPLPELKNPLSVEHALNAISLLTAILRGKSRG